ncbi:MAG: hypothetical protein DI551_06920 [Micavibrio aeruginosavorus]|uniref:Nitroreductase domain-containing protein n=1 Tax=Micavibrio aeruginosavorus TaxID=349221 RepID=A0A2W5MZL9_9BACT|nr:MAG: hypothetical protein DI551_06920 [Micavibrio aeruginosavorus]
MSAKFKVNPLAKISLFPEMKCELLLEGLSYKLPHTGYISFLSKLKGASGKDDIIHMIEESINKDAANDIFEDMCSSMILVDEDYEHADMDGARHWIKRGWLEGLFLHLKTRNISFSDTSGDTGFSAKESLAKLIETEGLPEIWKSYDDCRKFPLPKPQAIPEKSLEEVLLKRRSNRPWRNSSMSMEHFSSILHYANVETRRIRMNLEQNVKSDPELLLNSSFTALETYCLVMSVQDLTPGLYHYDPKSHQLSLIREGLFREEITKCCIGQSRPHDASCVFMISAVWERFMFRYRHARAYRTLLTNVSELGHKYLLLGTSLRLSTFMTPAFNDKYVDNFMGFNGYDEAVLYAIGLG